MEKKIKYEFHYRPGYGSEEFLIEFTSGVANDTFVIDFFDAIKEINPQIVAQEDFSLNDEILYLVNTKFGQFSLSIDIWDLAFAMSDDNQNCLFQINNLLMNDKRFEKIEVDFNNYKLDKNSNI